MQLLYLVEQARLFSWVSLLNDDVDTDKALGGGWNLPPENQNSAWLSRAAAPAPSSEPAPRTSL